MDTTTTLTLIGGILLTISFIVAVITYVRRVIFQRRVKLNQIYPLGRQANRLLFQIDSPISASVWSTSRKKIYKITKSGSRWYIQSFSNNKRILCTIKNSETEKFIVLNQQNPHLRNSPLGTTPSVLKYDSNWFNWALDYFAGAVVKSDFSFGTAVVLRWVGLNHFEMITKENNGLGTNEEPIDVHRRIAFVNEFDEDNQTGFNIWFDFERINVEILISSFLFSLLAQKSLFRGLLKPKHSKTSSVV